MSAASTDSISAIDSLIRGFSNPSNKDSASPKSINRNYSIGDVVRVNVMRRINTVTRLARIRAIDVKNDDGLLKLLFEPTQENTNDTNGNNNDNNSDNKNDNDDDDKDDDQKESGSKLENDNNDSIKYYGVEYFNYRKGNNQTDLIEDGIINGVTIFDVKKPGYGAFVTNKQIVGSALWTKSKSKKAMKLKSFGHQTFIRAAKYGSMPVIKHLLQMNDYPNDPSIITPGDKTKGLKFSAICAAIYYNHYEIVKLLLDKHLKKKDENKNNDDDNKQDMKYDINNDEYTSPKLRVFKPRRNSDVLQSKDGKTKFYNPIVFDKLCKDGNTKMLQLLLERDSWPIYYKASHALYQAVTSDDVELVKLLLSYMNNPLYINLPLFFDTKQRTIIPQTNLNILNVAIGHQRMDVIKYLITEWEYKDLIIKNRCIYHDSKPHQLPTLLYTILDCHLHYNRYINFTCDAIELFLRHCDPLDIGLNWVCDKRLSQQKNIVIGDITNNQCYDDKILYINRTLCIGTILAGLVYKCKALWQLWQSYDEEKAELKLGIERLITVLVQNGIDWNLAKFDKNVKNIWMKYTTYPIYKITDLDVDICDDQEFVKFFRNTVSVAIEKFRKVWLDSFLNFYKEDKLMANIFKWYVLDFVVPRKDILDSMKYFTIKDEKEEELKRKKKEEEEKKNDENYINWDDDEEDENDKNNEDDNKSKENNNNNNNNNEDDDEESEFDDPLRTSFGLLKY